MIENCWKQTWRERMTRGRRCTRWVNKMWDCLDRVKLHKGALVKTLHCPSVTYTKLIELNLLIAVAPYQLLSLLLVISSWSSSPSSLLFHFASDWGSGLCAVWGWLEHCAVHRGSRNLSSRALNVPLEQQFSAMGTQQATGEGAEGSGRASCSNGRTAQNSNQELVRSGERDCFSACNMCLYIGTPTTYHYCTSLSSVCSAVPCKNKFHSRVWGCEDVVTQRHLWAGFRAIQQQTHNVFFESQTRMRG